MGADDLLVTFTKADKSTLVFQAVSDIESSKAFEITTEPGVVERVGARYPRRFSMFIQVSNSLTNLPSVGASTGEFTRQRNAVLQNRELDSLVGKNVLIDARSVPDPLAVYTVESARAIDPLDFETGFRVQVTCTEDLSGKLTGGGFTTLRLGRITVPLAPIIDETLDAPLGQGEPLCTVVVPVKKTKPRGWLETINNTVSDAFEIGVDAIEDFAEGAVEFGEGVVETFEEAYEITGEVISDSWDLVSGLFVEEVTVLETRLEKCEVGDGA